MRPFIFCPSCASKLEEPGEENDRTCPSCGRTWYPNSAPTAGAAIFKDGRVLVTKRGVEPHKGKFDIPGGFLRAGEDVIVGLRRELWEELQVEVDVGIDDVIQMIPHTYGEENEYVLAIGFLARLVSGEVTPGSDVEEAHWIAPDDLDGVEFAWEHDRELVRKVFEHETQETADTH